VTSAARGPRRALRVEAPAKLNLGLRITGFRQAGAQRGYHELASVFVPIDYADEIEIALAESGPGLPPVELRVAGDVPGVPADASNLAARAAARFLEAAGSPARACLVLHKRVAAGAGLGGGSSDAGAVLRGLDRLLPGAVARATLEDLAVELGADVPFFLDPRPAWVTGIGERREPLPEIGPLVVVLAHPGVPLATAAVFRAFDEAHDRPGAALTRPDPPSTMPALSGLPGRRAGGDPRVLASQLDTLLENDLEPAALRLCPAIGGLREALRRAGALGVGLSGSGPTMFGVFADAAAARKAADGMELASPAWCRVASRWFARDEAE
jgi:4-diphosphocytidyl-2-C-methyl-D-erythritol kinase